jgi:hypothetical protein
MPKKMCAGLSPPEGERKNGNSRERLHFFYLKIERIMGLPTISGNKSPAGECFRKVFALEKKSKAIAATDTRSRPHVSAYPCVFSKGSMDKQLHAATTAYPWRQIKIKHSPPAGKRQKRLSKA